MLLKSLGRLILTVDPGRDVHIVPINNAYIDSAVRYTDMYGSGAQLGSKMIIDATLKWARHPTNDEWGADKGIFTKGARTAPHEPIPQAEIDKVKRKWSGYGFEKY